MFQALAIAAVVFSVGPAKETQFKDKKAKQMLVGKHPLTLQWITFGNAKAGEVDVTEDGGLLAIRGEQRDPNTGNYVTIDGIIESADAKSFVFDGTIVVRLHDENEGKPCTRQGRMNFRISGKRKYWRLKENQSPCSTLTDYVDIFFAS